MIPGRWHFRNVGVFFLIWTLGGACDVQDEDLPALSAAAWAAPDGANRPRMRWWWPGIGIDKAGIERDLDTFSDAGFGGVEICVTRYALRGPVVWE